MTKTAETGATVLDVRSVSQSTKDSRCLEVWFASNVTADDRAALLRAVNRDARFENVVGALEHALVRFRCLEDQFEESGDTASWAMCSVDADRMEKILTSIKASTS